MNSKGVQRTPRSTVSSGDGNTGRIDKSSRSSLPELIDYVELARITRKSIVTLRRYIMAGTAHGRFVLVDMFVSGQMTSSNGSIPVPRCRTLPYMCRPLALIIPRCVLSPTGCRVCARQAN